MPDLSTPHALLAAFRNPKTSTFQCITDLKPRADAYFSYDMTKNHATISAIETLLTFARKPLPTTKQKMFDSVFSSFGKPVYLPAPETTVNFTHYYNL